MSLTCLTAAAALGYARYRFEQIPRYGDITLASVATGEPENFLVVGSDSREQLDGDAADAGAFFDGSEPGGQRSDTVLVARVEPQAEQVKLLSIPRDLWLPIAGTGSEDRINTAYSNGRQVLIDTIQEALGIPINHYIEVDFGGFRRLVEAIDGVPMWFDTAMRDQHTGLVVNGEGCVTLDGQQALALARSRSLEYVEDGDWHTDPTGDLGRIARQQQLIVEAVRHAVSLDLTSASRFNELIDIGVDSVGIDEGLGFDALAGLALRFRSIGEDTVINRTLPVEDYTTAGGAAVLRIVEPDADAVLSQFRGHSTADYTPGLVQVKVINGSGAPGQAEAVGEALGTVGFQFTGTENTEGLPLAVTQVHFAPGEIVAADVVARHLTTVPELVQNAEVEAGTVVVVTGLDFTTVQENPRPADDGTPVVDRVDSGDGLVTNGMVEDPEAAIDVADGSEGEPITEAIGRPPSEDAPRSAAGRPIPQGPVGRPVRLIDPSPRSSADRASPSGGVCAGSSPAEGARVKAWVVSTPGPIDGGPLGLVDRPPPTPGPHEVRVRVLVCGVCRTDLHVAEGDLPVRRPGVVPGHEVVGVVDRVGPGASRFAVGERIGIAWLRLTCGTCRFCRGATRTSAWRHGSRAGMTTAATPTLRWSTSVTPTDCPKRSPMPRQPPSSVPGSSGSAPWCGPSSPTVGVWGSTGSAARPTSPPRSHWPTAPRCT